MNESTFYMPMTSPAHGALGIYHIHAEEDLLRTQVDERIGSAKRNTIANPLSINELRYGWLRDAEGAVVDEVLIAAPRERQRVLMTHGGAAVGGAVENCLRALGFNKINAGDFSDGAYSDPLFDPLLASCVTEGQAAAVLAEWARAAETGERFALDPEIMMVHRVVLAGAANAGKSSLLNALSGYRRAFVHEEAGATRDVVDELVDIGGYAVAVGDMPGYARGERGVAAEAWQRALRRLRAAEQVWFVVDGSGAWEGAARDAAAEIARAARGRVLVIVNKSDLAPGFSGEPWREYFPDAEAVRICSLPDGDARSVLARAFRPL